MEERQNRLKRLRSGKLRLVWTIKRSFSDTNKLSPMHQTPTHQQRRSKNSKVSSVSGLSAPTTPRVTSINCAYRPPTTPYRPLNFKYPSLFPLTVYFVLCFPPCSSFTMLSNENFAYPTFNSLLHWVYSSAMCSLLSTIVMIWRAEII